MKKLYGILFMVWPLISEAVTHVTVIKSKKTLYVYENSHLIGSYPVVFGRHPVGHKQQQGDDKTPEGHYQLSEKNSHSRYHRSIRISYPNEQDLKRAKLLGVSAGGDIMIHGQPNGFGWFSWLLQKFNWTKGCIALTNADMDRLWEQIQVPVDIVIKP